MTPVYFWQSMITPHMASLARSLAELGHDVTYCAASNLSPERTSQGWAPGALGHANAVRVDDHANIGKVIETAPDSAVHLIEGIRPQGEMAAAHHLLARSGSRIWWMGEELDLRGIKGRLRRRYYRYFVRRQQHRAEAVLAIGERMRGMMHGAGFRPEHIHPFTYFLDESDGMSSGNKEQSFTICFIGQMISRKRFDLLVDALEGLGDMQWHLDVAGDGVIAAGNRRLAEETLGHDRVNWRGRVPMSDVRTMIAGADLLILPSDHDGWGAVISEALIEGTAAICSSACGAREAVIADGGTVFPAGNAKALRSAIREALESGKIDARARLERRSRNEALTAPAGATYLSALIEGKCPSPPWLAQTEKRCAA